MMTSLMLFVGALVAAWPGEAIDVRYAPDGALGARWVALTFAEGSTLVVLETKVTCAQWQMVMGTIPRSGGKACAIPETAVGWVTPFSVLEFANRLSDLEGLDRCYEIATGAGQAETGELVDAWPVTSVTFCNGYRLPLPQEWATLLESEPLLDEPSQRGNIAWLNDPWKAYQVARKWPSYYGLYDLAGDTQEMGFVPSDPEPRDDIPDTWFDIEERRVCVFTCYNNSRFPCRMAFGLAGFFPDWGRAPNASFRLVRSY